MNTRRFMIGDAVLVMATVEAHYDEQNQRVIDRTELPEPKRGQVVGMARIYLGKYSPGSRGSWHTEDEPAYLSVKGCEVVWLVRFGVLNREVRVRDEDAELVAPAVHVGCAARELMDRVRKGKLESFLADDGRDCSLVQVCGCYAPLFDQKQPEWTPSQREFQRKEMVGMLRDEKGRWKKWRQG